jgi:hypothetical protein
LAAHAEKRRASATNEAADFLRNKLHDGPGLVQDIQKEAEARGISERTLRRARKKLGVKPGKNAFKGGWAWHLDNKDD